MSGVDVHGRQIRKGAAPDAIRKHVEAVGGAMPLFLNRSAVEAASRRGQHAARRSGWNPGTRRRRAQGRSQGGHQGTFRRAAPDGNQDGDDHG